MPKKETDGNSDVLCACGCGLHLRRSQAARGGKFRNKTHANRFRGKQNMGRKYNKQRMTFSQDVPLDGKEFCENYKNDILGCIQCVELSIFKAKPCYKERKK